LDIEIIRRICLARHLFELGSSGLKSANDLYLFSAANLIQDAVESFLLGVADRVSAGIKPNTSFDQYFDLINKKISPKELPFRNQLLRLNKIRINSKHYGIQPAREECIRLSVSVREFFEEVCSSILDINFSTVSAIDFLEKGSVKDTLLEAKSQLELGKIQDCSISCRKALYLEIEKDFDVSCFTNERSAAIPLLGCKSPYYTQNKSYIDNNVKDPTDYIVYDYIRLDQKLLTDGVDNTSFWNIYRLTPDVFRKSNGEWVVKWEFNKLTSELLDDQIEYIFNTSVDIIFSIHAKRKSIKTSNRVWFNIKLKREEVPVYEKADANSKIVQTTPAGLIEIESDFMVEGIDGGGPYYKVHYFERERDIYFSGYIHGENVNLE
jgi:hypothetical protein